MLTCGDIKPGQVFRYATMGTDAAQFIKLGGTAKHIKGKCNAINLWKWHAVYVDERAAVELLGTVDNYTVKDCSELTASLGENWQRS